MVRQLITLCDPCFAEDPDSRIEGEEVTVTVDRLRPHKPRKLALCKRHDQELLAPFLEVLEEYGLIAPDDAAPVRSQRGGRPKRSAATSSDEPTLPLTETPKGYPMDCPLQGHEHCRYVATKRDQLAKHLRSFHKTSLAVVETDLGHTVEGRELKAFCEVPGCGLGFTSGTGLSSHMRGDHPELAA